jgi:hypothetical protein
MEHCVYFVTLSAYVVREEKGNMIFYELCFHIPDSLAKIELSTMLIIRSFILIDTIRVAVNLKLIIYYSSSGYPSDMSARIRRVV